MARHPRAERVLIIDDDVMSREILTVLLEGEDFLVETASSGDAALAHLHTTPSPGIILSDVQMPGLSGVALAHALRSACPPATLLLAMSGSQPPPATCAAFDAFLLKPFRTPQLRAVLAACRTTIVVQPTPGTALGETPLAGSGASNHSMSTFTQEDLSPYETPVRITLSQPANAALDERIYRQLNEAMPRVQLRQMYVLCIDDVRARIATMRSHAALHDADQFVRQAHAVKGGCGMLGASELYIMASELEKEGLTSAGLDGVSGSNPLDELAAACDRLERILGTRT